MYVYNSTLVNIEYLIFYISKLIGNPKCDIKTTKTYDRECCSVDNPCGLGQGDCDKDDECSGDLVCGRDNCGMEYKSATADCCQFRGNKIYEDSIYKS